MVSHTQVAGACIAGRWRPAGAYFLRRPSGNPASTWACFFFRSRGRGASLGASRAGGPRFPSQAFHPTGPKGRGHWTWTRLSRQGRGGGGGCGVWRPLFVLVSARGRIIERLPVVVVVVARGVIQLAGALAANARGAPAFFKRAPRLHGMACSVPRPIAGARSGGQPGWDGRSSPR